ncbi:hypothetical protein F53441_10806 [Fusarium austroafricanum]|uniref:Uncharacterized protein n=1 Tax=Fusarium austroafricanum TaxID=2364996 RepID=A0A8H4KAJ8_9HYPO|nr:hypothetical protein F53441_10806 [Fusarium austroafricanum]
MSQSSDQNRVKARIAELEAELSNLRVSQWASVVDDMETLETVSDAELTNTESISQFSMLERPTINLEDLFPGRRTQATQAESTPVNDPNTEHSVKFRDDESVHSNITETAHYPADDASPEDELRESQAGPAEENQGWVVVEANSPKNTDNPHPTLSISIEFLHMAIINSRNPRSCFVRSILRRERIDNDQSIFYQPETLFLNGVYTDWKWIPFLISGDAGGIAVTNIREGDIELICIRDSIFTRLIQQGGTMFEKPERLAKRSFLLENLKLDFKGPESEGFRVLVWRVHHGFETTFYMDREGHPIPGVLGRLPWQATRPGD